MTCASCAARIESGLGGLPGVDDCRRQLRHQPGDGHLRPRGHRARRRSRPRSPISATRCPTPSPTTPRPTSVRDLRRRASWSRWCSASPCSRSRWCRRCSSTAGSGSRSCSSTPVILWSAWPFHRATLVNLRHGATTWTRSCRWAPSPRTCGRSSRWCSSAPAERAACRWARCSAARATARTSTSRPPARSSRCCCSGSTSRPVRAAGRATRCVRCSSSARRPRASRTATRSRSATLRVGDRFVVRPGEKIATDGIGRRRRRRPSTCRCSPASRCRSTSTTGDAVFGATVNTSGRLVVEATRVGDDTALAQIARLVEEAQGSKAPVQRLADRISAVFVPVVLVIARASRSLVWLRARQPGRRGVHRRGGGADHRLPVRARSRHAHRDHGRHRSRRPARHRDQGRRGARGHAGRRRRRARQDRHHHRGPHGAGRRRRRAGRRRRRAAATGRFGRGRVGASDRARGRRRCPRPRRGAGARRPRS